MTWGGARLDAIDRSPMASELGHSGRASLVVTGPARRTPFELRIPAAVLSFGARSVREPVLLTLPLGRAPPQGAILDAIATVRAPRGPERGFDERGYLRRRGVHVVLDADRARVVGRRGGLSGLADRLRAHIAATMAPGLSGERRAVVAGVVLGEDEGLPRDVADAFRASGLFHLLAVSGQNVALIVGGVIGLTLLVGVSRLAGEAVAIAAVLGYLAAVGWQPSVVRAGVAGVLASLAYLVARPRDRWYFLLAGAAVLLAWSPYAALEPGFQLSFGAVVAIFMAVPWILGRLEGYPIGRGAADALALSLACGVATAPVLLWHFGTVPAYSVLSNVLAAPAVAPLLGCGLVAAAVHPVWPPAAEALAVVEGWLAAYLVVVARTVAALPYAEVGPVAAAATAAALAAAVVVVRKFGRRGLAACAVSVVLAAGGRQLWPAAELATASVAWAPGDGPRRRPGRRHPAPDGWCRRARRPGAARGARGPAARAA